MKTEQIFKFVVRKEFNNFKKGDKFEAAVRTYVVAFHEMQDFEMPDGTKIEGVPCGHTRFEEE